MDLTAGRGENHSPLKIGRLRSIAEPKRLPAVSHPKPLRHVQPGSFMARSGVVFLLSFVSGLLIDSAVSGADQLQKNQAKVDQRFLELDRDHNGSITSAELPQTAVFNSIDANRDGQISLEEARAHFSELRSPQSGSTKDASNSNAKLVCDPSIPRRFRRLKPSEHSVGRIMPSISFRDIDGGHHNLADCKSMPAMVIAVTSTTCPLSKRFLPTFAKIEKLYSPKIRFIYVNPISTDSNESIRSAIQSNDLKGPYVRDPDGTLLSALGARSSTDCFVVDQAMTLCYRGAVDDQYGIGYSLAEPRQSLLAEALESVIVGRTPTIAATDAPGCRLKFASGNKSKTAKSTNQVTYHNRISRILQIHCAECHHEGGVAPFALTSYQDAQAHAGMIAEVLKDGTMPPWFAAPQKSVSMAWMHDRSLSAADKADLLTWLDGDQAVGNPAESPVPIKFSDDWHMGTPDALWSIPKPISIPASGVMPYQTAITETHLAEDKWVSGFEIRPTARGVVHHVGVFVETGPNSEQMSTDAENTGSYFALYVPGSNWRRFPEGCAKLLPKGAKLRFEIHYTPNGTATEDQTQIGFYFSNKPPQHELKMIGIVNRTLKIPPQAPNHAEMSGITLPNDIQIVSLMPHMHARGKAFRIQSISKSGEVITLLDVPRYDFNWQLAYQFATPQSIAKGTKIKVTGWFDNSERNPANPDPLKTVTFGPQSADEMLVGYVEFIVPSESPAATSR